MIQINDDYYEDLNVDSTRKILEAFERDEHPKVFFLFSIVHFPFFHDSLHDVDECPIDYS